MAETATHLLSQASGFLRFLVYSISLSFNGTYSYFQASLGWLHNLYYNGLSCKIRGPNMEGIPSKILCRATLKVDTDIQSNHVNTDTKR